MKPKSLVLIGVTDKFVPTHWKRATALSSARENTEIFVGEGVDMPYAIPVGMAQCVDVNNVYKRELDVESFCPRAYPQLLKVYFNDGFYLAAIPEFTWAEDAERDLINIHGIDARKELMYILIDRLVIWLAGHDFY